MAATSCASPTRRSGVIPAMNPTCSSVMWAVASVRVRPGATVLTRMPWGPSSKARAFISPSTADLLVVWAVNPNDGYRDSPLLMPTMQPSRRSIMAGMKAFAGRKKLRISSRTLVSKASCVSSVTPAKGTDGPALSTRMSTGPSSAVTAAAMAWTWPASRTSAPKAAARPPEAVMSATTWSAASPLAK